MPDSPTPLAAPIRVLIADDHAAVREGVRAVLSVESGIDVVGEAIDGPAALRLVRELAPDLVVLDNSMPGLSGLDVSRRLASDHPDVAVVFLTLDPALRDLALAGGAMAYVMKDAPSDELVRAVRATTAAIAARRRVADLPAAHRRILDLLISTRTLSDARLNELLAKRHSDETPAALLRRLEAVPESELADVLAHAAGTPMVSLAPYPEIGRPIQPTEDRLSAPRMLDPVDAAAVRSLPLDVSRSMNVALIAMSQREGTGVLAMADPLDDASFAEAQRVTRLRLSRVAATATDIAEAIERAWSAEPVASPFSFRLTSAWQPLLTTVAIVALPIAGVLLLFREGLAPNRIFALIALLCGFFFFAYALKYYISSAAVLAIAVFGDTLVAGRRGVSARARQKSGTHRFADGATKARLGGEHREGYKTLRGEKLDEVGAVADGGPLVGDLRLPVSRQPFVSVQVALYNEAHVVDRLLAACTSFDYENYEVIVADDSTDETVEILQRWRNHPRVKILHRTNRKGFKGGALQEALRRMNPRAEYVMIFDADFIPPADAIWHFLDYFGRLSTKPEAVKTNGNGHNNSTNGVPQNGDRLAAVQGYQWHMLNASENWVTKGVRAEFAGSYVLERAGQELFGTMKMISGSVYMIRADVLRKLGWSTSITEDWELTIRLYLAGYKVLYTPYIQAPAECVSTVKRLIRQRMRWAEGHTYNVKKYLLKVLRSPNLTWKEKLEFVYYAPYYLQSVVFAAGTVAWLLADLLLGQRLPNWTALLGWSLVFTNIFALPLMNLAGVALEGSVRRDIAGIFSFIALSNLLVPFQAYAAIKGLLEREEGGWVRTPKSGRITESLGTFHLSRILPWELPGRGRRKPAFRIPRAVVGGSFVLLAVGVLGLGAFSIRTAAATPGAKLMDLALLPGLLGTIVPLALIALAYWKARSLLLSCGLFLALSINLVSLGSNVPVALAANNVFYLHNAAAANGKSMDATPGSTVATVTVNGSSSVYWFSPTYPTGATNGSIASGTWTISLNFYAQQLGSPQAEITAWICPAAGSPCTTQIAQVACFVTSPAAPLQTFNLTPNPAAAQTLAAPANSWRVGVQLRACNAKWYQIKVDGAVGSGYESNLSTPAVTVPDATLWLIPLALAAPLVIRRMRRQAPALVA